MGPLALLGALISLAERGIAQSVCDGQKSKTICVLQFNTAASWESAPSRSFGCAQPLCDSQKNATLVAFLNTGFAVLLSKYFTARITINKKAPVFRLRLFYLLGAWRCTTLAWQLPHYHRRSCVSLLSSEWIQVVPQRYCHQAKTVCLSLTK